MMRFTSHRYRFLTLLVFATNSLDNYWSLFKRCINGTYVSVEPFHLFRYLDEEDFRFNERKGTDATRFLQVAAAVPGKRLMYKELIGEDGAK